MSHHLSKRSSVQRLIHLTIFCVVTGLCVTALIWPLSSALGSPASTGTIAATPNPIVVCDGTGLGVTQLSWSSSDASIVEVHLNSPAGPLVASGLSGTFTTSKSVSDGTVFYLQDVSGKSAQTIATVTVGVTTAGCPGPTPTPTPTASNQIGRLTSSGNGQRRTSYEYDVLGRTTRTLHNFEGQSKTFTTAYGLPQSQVSPTGHGTVPTSQTFPDNERVEYTYDASGAQQSIKTRPSGGAQQTIINGILRNSRGQTIRAEYGNGAVTTYDYNDLTNLRLNRIKTVVGAQTLQDYTYIFDNNGNVARVDDAVTSSLNASYGYDSLDQLISMTPVGSVLPYSYDKLGNLTNKENVLQTYGGAQSCTGCPQNRGPHALATSHNGTLTYNYDFNGNLLSTSNGSNVTNITWNSENMPISVVQGEVTMYRKSFVGESLWKKIEPNVTTYYLPSMRIENGQVRKFFAGFAERSPDNSLKFYHGDHLGSASLVTDSTGGMVRRQAYLPYGSDRFIDPAGTFTPKYQFNFKEKEESTGFYDYGARLYNPATGRWLSADTSSADGLNRYAYVSNNPLRYIDPTGHQQGEADTHNEVVVKALTGLNRHATMGIFLKGMWNDGIDPGLDDLMQQVLKVERIVSVPNSNGLLQAAFALPNGRSVETFKRIVEGITFRVPFNRVTLATHSNGVDNLLAALESRGPIVPRNLAIFAPNVMGLHHQSLHKLDRLLTLTGNAPVTFYVGDLDMTSLVPTAQFVPTAGQLAEHFENNRRVTVISVEAGHKINLLGTRVLGGRWKTILDRGKLIRLSTHCCATFGTRTNRSTFEFTLRESTHDT